MRRKRISLDDAAERLELPQEAFGALLVTAVGSNCVLVENHRGIAQYGTEYIRLNARGGSFSVFGSDIRIRALGKSKLALEGKIRSMEWET